MGLWKKFKKKVKANQKSWEKNSNRFLHKLGASNVSSQFNFKKLVTDPKDYFKNNYDNFKNDAVHAVGVYKKWVTGDWGTLAKEGTRDTRAAFGLKENKKQEKEAEAIGETAAKIDQGDYQGALDAAAKSDSLVGQAAQKAQPYASDVIKYGQLGSDLYSDYKTGGDEGAKRAIKHVADSDIEGVSTVAGYASTGITAYEQGRAGDYAAASRTVKEGDMGFLSDLGGYAEKGAEAYEKGKASYDKGRAEYDRGRASYDQGTKLANSGGSMGEYMSVAGGYLNQADTALSKVKATASDFRKQTKPRKDTDRALARNLTGTGNPGAPRPPTHAPSGIGGIIGDLLRAIGL